MKRGLLGLTLAAVALACTDSSTAESSAGATETETGDEPAEFVCAVERAFPYPSMPYVGVHASRRNDDLVDCELASIVSGGWAQAWHVLDGYGIAQPNTFSPDGLTTYVTTTEPTPGACTVWADFASLFGETGSSGLGTSARLESTRTARPGNGRSSSPASKIRATPT